MGRNVLERLSSNKSIFFHFSFGQSQARNTLFLLCERKSLKSIELGDSGLGRWCIIWLGGKSSYVKAALVRKSSKICPSPKSKKKPSEFGRAQRLILLNS